MGSVQIPNLSRMGFDWNNPCVRHTGGEKIIINNKIMIRRMIK